MHRRDLLLLIISLLVGFFGFIMALNIIKSKSQPSFQFVAATENITIGQVVQDFQVTLSQPLKNQNYGELFLTPADVVGRVANQDIPAGNLIYRTQVDRIAAAPLPTATEAPAKPVKLDIPAGKKSFVLPAVSVESYPEGVEAGSYLDIFGTMPGPDGKNELSALVHGVNVLSIHAKDSGEIQSMTVAMTPEALTLVTRAIGNGKLRLSLGVEQEEVIAYTIGEFTEIIRGVTVTKNTLTKPSGQSSGQQAIPPPGTPGGIMPIPGVAGADYYGAQTMMSPDMAGASNEN